MIRINRFSFMILIVALFAMVPLMGVSANTGVMLLQVPDDAECLGRDLRLDLSGAITNGGLVGTVTNNSDVTCTYLLGMASYEKFDEIIDNQQLFSSSSQSVQLAPDQSFELRVALPNCAAQIDLFYGDVLASLNGARYGDRLLDALHIGGTNYCGGISDDQDQDGVPDAVDNCPTVPNTFQENLDGDGFGDVCDDDIDGDLYLNNNDCAPRDFNINPGAIEIPGNGIDENCDGSDILIGSGDVQITLTWDNNADMDLHVFEPNGTHIWFASRGPTATGGQLDLDSNAGCGGPFLSTENVFWPIDQSPEGIYTVEVDVWSACSLPPANWHLVVQIAGVGVIINEYGQGNAIYSFSNGEGPAPRLVSSFAPDANILYTTANTNARTCPDTSCDIVATVPFGSGINAINTVEGQTVGNTSRWYVTTIDGEEVYLYGGLLVERMIK